MYMSYSNPPFQLNRPFELLPRQDDAAEPVFKLYHYDPTIAGAVIFVLLFVGTTGFHFYQLWRARTWFMIPLMLGGIRKSPQDAVSSAILLLQAGITARTPQHPRYMSLRRRSLQEANLANSPAQWNLWATQAEPGQDLRVQTGHCPPTSSKPCSSSSRRRCLQQQFTWSWAASSLWLTEIHTR